MIRRLFLIVTIAGQRVMVPAATVESVVEVGMIEPVPLVAPHVAGLFALRSRVMTVIDSAIAVGAPPMQRSGQTGAVVVNCEGHGYAILVEKVDDVIETDVAMGAPRVPLDPAWAGIALGVLEIDGDAVLVVDPARLAQGGAYRLAA